ncbi:ATP-binding protein [Tumidithrix elongata RA019]|uniref:Circadian input-output histidine kinase CikA n=1 Tax=Tumidithrix elongata BACA0141 TaxID=2716417 RepID=A0AAW9PWC4_9CYAN|nr:ATP-binding protein [Tumidithrix elongata RA019]
MRLSPKILILICITLIGTVGTFNTDAAIFPLLTGFMVGFFALLIQKNRTATELDELSENLSLEVAEILAKGTFSERLSEKIEEQNPELATTIHVLLEALAQKEQQLSASQDQLALLSDNVGNLMAIAKAAETSQQLTEEKYLMAIENITEITSERTEEEIAERKKAEVALQESETKFRTLADSTFEGIVIHEQGIILEVNARLAEMLGYEADELIGMNALDLVTPESRELVQGSIESHHGQLYEITSVRKDGSIFISEVRSKAIPYQGKIVSVAAIHNITERKRIELELLEANAYLNAIIDNLGDGLMVIDINGCVDRINPALNALYDDGQNLIGCHYRDKFNPELGTLVDQTIQSPREVFTAEIELPKGRFGKAVATAINRMSVESSDSYVCIGTVILIRDITAEKEVDQMKTDFISNVSHELRTPLTSILGFAKVIDRKLVDNLFPLILSEDKKVKRSVRQVEENLNIIVSETKRLTEIINNVLDISNMESGKLEWNMEPVAIAEVIEQAIADTNPLFQQKGIELTVDLAPEMPKLNGDKQRLVQVMSNLLSNAVKFTDIGTVTCSAQCDGDRILVKLTDKGIGIAEQDRLKVFEKFKQVGDILTNKPKGTGLGLPICKEIVEHHGGKIWVESKLGRGSTFSFFIPII